jgi:hypothetical protein
LLLVFFVKDTFMLTRDNIYFTIAHATLKHLGNIPPNNLAQRYYEVLVYQFGEFVPHRAEIGQVFGVAIHAENTPDMFATDPMREVFSIVVRESTDAPNKADDKHAMSALLYALYMVTITFWLYDRTPNHQATAQLLDFMREMIRIFRPMLMMPMFTKALHKMSSIFGLVFTEK